jgi:hypothetical protein
VAYAGIEDLASWLGLRLRGTAPAASPAGASARAAVPAAGAAPDPPHTA